MYLGNCPCCNGKVISRKITAKGKQIKLYTCENSKKEYDESDSYVFSHDSTCRFRVYSNVFLKWNKRSFSEYEMKKLLEEKSTIVRLFSNKSKKEYFKYVTIDHEYGVNILWDEEVA